MLGLFHYDIPSNHLTQGSETTSGDNVPALQQPICPADDARKQMPVPSALFTLQQFWGFCIMIKSQLLREGSSMLEEISNVGLGVRVTAESSPQDQAPGHNPQSTAGAFTPRRLPPETHVLSRRHTNQKEDIHQGKHGFIRCQKVWES